MRRLTAPKHRHPHRRNRQSGSHRWPNSRGRSACSARSKTDGSGFPVPTGLPRRTAGSGPDGVWRERRTWQTTGKKEDAEYRRSGNVRQAQPAAHGAPSSKAWFEGQKHLEPQPEQPNLNASTAHTIQPGTPVRDPLRHQPRQAARAAKAESMTITMSRPSHHQDSAPGVAALKDCRRSDRRPRHAHSSWP